MRLALILACALILVPPARGVMAQEQRPAVLMCQMIDESGTGWVPDFLMLTRRTSGPESGRIEVFDGVLQTLVGRPIQAFVTADGRDSRSYGWALAGVRNAAGQRAERLDYRLTVHKADGAARLEVVAQGYDNIMTGSGVCGSPDG
ncbi:hypothetical protein SAMN04487972_11642 [Paracoccus halophilus]|uniref:Uncharacterized protein n=1 Tax=Paracoccus halophilus TaxID=376733 RepID=A0A099F0W2_9RHOB|nr:hypothetical protein [Paracoccus halophilus]KGJ03812.1 hypothetical protein IT41_12810 [Paracoccus halophilus]SFA56964.1 hypothetical protein SAMN04487972_11642 [Paracoccus halophilus]